MTTPRRPRFRPTVPGLLLLAASLFLPGCGGGGGTPGKESEADQVAQAVREFQGATANPKWFAGAFAQGAAPAEAQRKRYVKHTYAPGSVSISGDTATIKIKVCDEKYEKVLSETEWTLVKEGGQWKLKSAPLP